MFDLAERLDFLWRENHRVVASRKHGEKQEELDFTVVVLLFLFMW